MKNLFSILLFSVLFLFFSCVKEGNVASSIDLEEENIAHVHDSHPENSIYFDFRGMTDSEIKQALATETGEELSLRTESHRIATYLTSIGLKERITETLSSKELFTSENVSNFLNEVQQKMLQTHLPLEEGLSRSCSYYGYNYSCVSSSSSPSTQTTIPPMGNGSYSKHCYYKNNNHYIHYHHSHNKGGC